MNWKSEEGAATAEYAIATIVPMGKCSQVDNHIAATVAVFLSTHLNPTQRTLLDKGWLRPE
jgi:hypothetical protein